MGNRTGRLSIDVSDGPPNSDSWFAGLVVHAPSKAFTFFFLLLLGRWFGNLRFSSQWAQSPSPGPIPAPVAEIGLLEGLGSVHKIPATVAASLMHVRLCCDGQQVG